MKTRLDHPLATQAGRIALATVMVGGAAQAGPRTSTNYSVPAETTDGGGRRITSGNYTNDGSLGGVAGISTVSSPDETAKAGYIGQLYEATALQVTASPATVDESSTRQLGATQILDDDSTLAVSAASVSWSVVSGPLAGIDTNGLATAAAVFEDTTATAQGDFGGLPGQLILTVFDSISDNFGSYAGDGLDDRWQNQYFGLDNPDADPSRDPDGDGQDNGFEFTAGLVPTDAASRFLLAVETVPGKPTHKKLVFSPRFEDRDYSIRSKSDLTTGSWEPLVGFITSDNGEVRSVTDLDAGETKKFYQVEITVP